MIGHLTRGNIMDVIALKEYLKNSPERIEALLNSAGFHHIKTNTRTQEIRCSNDYDGNPTGIAIKYSEEHMPFLYFSGGLSGDIISLLQYKLDKPFRWILKYIYKELGLSDDELTPVERYKPFGEYYKKLQPKNNIKEVDLITYPDTVIESFKLAPNMLFLKDGISIDTQKKYCIGYDSFSMRISVPWYNHNGDVIGVMGRLNEYCVDENISKWLPIIPFTKSKALYGYNVNYSSIQSKKICIIGESEKFPQQLDSMDMPYGVALGGHYISQYHERYIKSLNADKYILMLDEGIDEDFIRAEAEKLKPKSKFQTHKIGYVYDKENIILKKGSKMSPTDVGRDRLKELYKNHTVWL